jgi:hypothetical protein
MRFVEGQVVTETTTLNEKIAKWCGFTTLEGVQSPFRMWLSPEGKHELLPDFTTSLDALFKWAVPRLLEGHYEVILSGELWHVGKYHYNCELVSKYRGDPDILTEYFETPALALCKAIEKVVD